MWYPDLQYCMWSNPWNPPLVFPSGSLCSETPQFWQSIKNRNLVNCVSSYCRYLSPAGWFHAILVMTPRPQLSSEALSSSQLRLNIRVAYVNVCTCSLQQIHMLTAPATALVTRRGDNRRENTPNIIPGESVISWSEQGNIRAPAYKSGSFMQNVIVSS